MPGQPIAKTVKGVLRHCFEQSDQIRITYLTFSITTLTFAASSLLCKRKLWLARLGGLTDECDVVLQCVSCYLEY